MPRGKIFEDKSRGRRKTAVIRPDRIEFHVPVYLLCVFLAIVVWLYVVNFEDTAAKPNPPGTAPATQAAQVSPADSDLCVTPQGL